MAGSVPLFRGALRSSALLVLAALLALNSVAVVAGEKIQEGASRSLASAGTSHGQESDKVSSRSVSARKAAARATFLDATYGNWCGLGRSGPAAPTDNLDTCCQAHDGCHAGNCVTSTSNCNCQRNFQTCLNNVLKGCSIFNFSNKCTYARNAKIYVNEVIKTACNGAKTNLFCSIAPGGR